MGSRLYARGESYQPFLIIMFMAVYIRAFEESLCRQFISKLHCQGLRKGPLLAAECSLFPVLESIIYSGSSQAMTQI